jgi:hypothetical protein
MRFAQREYGDAGDGDGVARVMATLEWIHLNVDYATGISNADHSGKNFRPCAATSPIWESPLRGH